MEKAIDIKRRAQRCLQGGDLAGAVSEYEKLTRAEDAEPINFVLLADLLYKKGDADEAVRRYLQAVDAYTGAGLYKNAIAVCKKMTRLSLASGVILQRLAELHALDGLATEAALYGMGNRKAVVILGGDGKGQDFGPLKAAVEANARAVLLIGRDAPLIAAALAGSGVETHPVASLREAVEQAQRLAHPGDAVLLSPACASFDMFRNYEERGDAFARAVRALDGAQAP